MRSLREICERLERGEAPRVFGTRSMFDELGLASGHPWLNVVAGGYESLVTYYYALGGLVHELAPRSALEIGTGFGLGAGTILFAGAATLKSFTTVDLDLYTDGPDRETVRGNLSCARTRLHRWVAAQLVRDEPAPNTRFVRGNTQPTGSDNHDTDAADVPHYFGCELEERSLDFIFVDGKHTGWGAYEDLETFWPKLAPGGVVLVDDLHARELDPRHVRWPWCDDVLRSFRRFVAEHASEIAETHIWRWPAVGARPDGERPWGLLRRAS